VKAAPVSRGGCFGRSVGKCLRGFAAPQGACAGFWVPWPCGLHGCVVFGGRPEKRSCARPQRALRPSPRSRGIPSVRGGSTEPAGVGYTCCCARLASHRRLLRVLLPTLQATCFDQTAPPRRWHFRVSSGAGGTARLVSLGGVASTGAHRVRQGRDLD
jgi:hypothetical protein